MNVPLVGSMLALAVGTYACRLAGPALRSRIDFPPRVEKLLEMGAVVLLAALALTMALTEEQGLAGVAWPAGVLAGGVLAWRRAPFLPVVLTAAGVTALLRLLGVP